MNHPLFSALAVACLAPLVVADGDEMLGPPSVAIANTATDVIVAGVGFSGGQPDSVSFNVPAGVTVLQVLAYWEGFALAAGEQGATDTIQVDFGPGFVNVTGDRIGGPSEFIQPQSYWTSTYRAMIDPQLVSPGANTWSVQGLDFGFVNNGLGVVLLVDDGGSTSVAIQDGNDSAFVNFASPFDTTMEVVFDFDPVDADRNGAISHLVSSVTSASSVGPDRPTVIRVGFDDEPFSVVEVDRLGMNALTPPGGLHFWDGDMDVLRHLITVPANSSRVRIQVFSEDSGVGPFAGRLPASLVWLTTAFTLELPEQPAQLGDTVFCDVDDDGVQDAGEPGIEGAIVVLTCAGPDGVLDTLDDLVDTMVTDADGKYLFTGLPPGLCRAEVDVNSVEDKVPGRCPLVFDVDLAPGQSFLDADFCFVEPPGGGEGCTPGYWKQRHHFDSWPAAYQPGMAFDAVFENAFDGRSLVQVLGTGGGGLRALGRHTVAALLNATSPGVDYDLTPEEVISLFNDVYPGSKQDYEALKDYFEAFNEQGCPLN